MEAPMSPHASALASLNDLEFFVLNDPSACSLYKQYLSSTCPSGRQAYHLDFLLEIANIEEQEWMQKEAKKKKRGGAGEGDTQEELRRVYTRYIMVEAVLLLDIPVEWLEKVRENVRINVNLMAFRPAIRMVVRELAFVHFEGFLQSAIFKDYKECVLASSGLLRDDAPRSPREKQRVYKLRSFFGEKVLRDSPAWKRRSLDHQPSHIKEFKLSKRFGERVGIEKASLLRDEEEDDASDESNSEEQLVARRHRRLHVFFGDNFEVDDTIYSERIRAQSISAEVTDCQKQPTHVNTYRLARFFGTSPPTKNEQGDYDSDGTLSRHSKTRHLHKFFGERMDPAKESSSVAFATQPSHVSGYKLKQIFGESAAHTINFAGGTWPRSSRAKLEKIFGPFRN